MPEKTILVPGTLAIVSCDDRHEAVVSTLQPQAYSFARHPDVVAIERPTVGVRHAELVLLDFPGTCPTRAGFCADQGAIGPQVHRPVGGVGNFLADDPCSDFLAIKHFET